MSSSAVLTCSVTFSGPDLSDQPAGLFPRLSMTLARSVIDDERAPLNYTYQQPMHYLVRVRVDFDTDLATLLNCHTPPLHYHFHYSSPRLIPSPHPPFPFPLSFHSLCCPGLPPATKRILVQQRPNIGELLRGLYPSLSLPLPLPSPHSSPSPFAIPLNHPFPFPYLFP